MILEAVVATTGKQTMKRMHLVVGCITVATAFGALLLASRPLPDEVLITGFSQKRDRFEEIARMYVADQNEAFIDVAGHVWRPKSDATSIGQNRIDQYRQQLSAVGAASIAGSGKSDFVVIQMHAPLQLPFGPVKSYVYSTQPPETLTEADTDRFEFAPAQRQRVCREIAGNWYVCMDNED